MENWGLIVYREQYLFADESSHHFDFLEVPLVISHELAHQFFGNVVTCAWWDQIWLNEGLASLFEYLLTDNLYPEMRAWEYFNVNKMQFVFTVETSEHLRCKKFKHTCVLML